MSKNLNFVLILTLCHVDCKFNRSIIDANFIHQYFMPDTIINLIDFNFYVTTRYELKTNDIEKVIHSFKIHPVFIKHQWTNIRCFADPISSYQHISFSNIYMPPFFHCLT